MVDGLFFPSLDVEVEGEVEIEEEEDDEEDEDEGVEEEEEEVGWDEDDVVEEGAIVTATSVVAVTVAAVNTTSGVLFRKLLYPTYFDIGNARVGAHRKYVINAL